MTENIRRETGPDDAALRAGFVDRGGGNAEHDLQSTYPVPATAETTHVLYIDGDPETLAEAAARLTEAGDGFVVDTVRSARAVRERFTEENRSEEVDCIVSGYALPDGNGLELLERVRETRPDLPFVLYADRDPAEIADDAYAAGATSYLQKRGPEQYPVLADLITDAVGRYRRSAAFERTTEFYHTVLENVSETALLTDDDGEFLWICPNVHRVFGYSAGEVADLGSIGALFDGEPIDPAAVPGEGSVENVEATISTGDGTERAVLVTATGAEVDEDAVLYTVRETAERTERKRVWDSAPEPDRDDRFARPAIDTLPVEVAVLDSDGTIRWTNRAWRDFAAVNGLSLRRDTIGVNYLEVTARADSDTARRAVTGLETVLSGETEEFELEYPCHSPDEKRWFLMRAVPFTVEDDRYVAVAHIDITDRKERERKLKTADTVFQHAQDPAFLVDVVEEGEEFLVRRVNEAYEEATGFSADDLAGKTPREIVGDEFGAAIETRYRECVNRREPITYEETVPVTGETRYWQTKIAPIVEDGTVVELVGTTRDITERRAYRDRLGTLHETTRELMQAPDVETIVDIVCDAARDVLGLAESGLFRYDETDDGIVSIGMSDGIATVFGGEPDVLPEGNIPERLLETGEELVVEDVSQLDLSGVEEVPRWALFGTPLDEGTALVVLDDTPDSLDERTVELARILSTQTAAALERLEHERELRESERRYRAIFNQTYQFTGLLDSDGTILEANDTALEFGGVDDEEAIGEKMWETPWFQHSKETRERAREAVERAADGEFVRHELPVLGADREAVIDFSVRPVTDEDGDVTLLIPEGRDITELKREQRRTEQVLTAIKEMVPALQVADSKRTIADVTADTIVDVLDHAVGGVYFHDETEGVLEPAAVTPIAEELFDEIPTFVGDDSIAWRAFARGASVHAEAVRSHPDVYNPETPLDSELALPLGSHGVVLIGSRDRSSFPEWEQEFASTLTTVVETALDRLDARDTLPEYERTIERTEDRLEQVRSLVRLARDVTGTVVGAPTRSGIESGVCETLCSVDPFELAWFGRTDGDDGISVDAWSCDDDQVTSLPSDRVGGEREHHPARGALETGTIRIRSEFGAGERTPWMEEALARGYKSCCAIPLLHGGTRHGVVTLFADDPTAFDDDTVRVLDGVLGPIVACALSGADRKQALVSDRTDELEFRVTGDDLPFVSLADRLGCEIGLQEVVHGPDGSIVARYAIDGVPPERVAGAAGDLSAVESTRVTGEGSVQLTQSTGMSRALAEHGCTLRTATADGTGGRITVGVPDDVSPRRIVETIERTYPGAELLAKRDGVSGTDRHGVGTLFDRRLTDRQREVLETAVAEGYVRIPRECTGEEIAAQLDIAQPTFNQHFWSGLERLLEAALEGDDCRSG